MLKQAIKYKQQKGFTFFGWVIVLAIFLYFAYLAMVLFPVMVDNYTTTNILESLKSEPGITKKSKRDVLKLIDKRLLINQVRSVSKDDFEIIKDGHTMEVFLEYDDKVHFMGNVYILIERNKYIELIGN